VPPRADGRLPRLQGRKAEPPWWGYRRSWADVHGVEGWSGQKTRGLRVRREHPLVVPPHPQLKAKRPPSRSTPRPTPPPEWWGRERPKGMVEGVGGGDSVLVWDGSTPTIVAASAGVPCTARPWLAALDRAVSRPLPTGARDQGLSVLRAHGGQPTAVAVMKAGRPVGSQQAFSSDNKPPGQAETARVLRPRKEACRWRQEWTRPLAVIRAREGWSADANEPSPHSALGYQSPRPFARQASLSHGTPFVAA
jgi:putative transposase